MKTLICFILLAFSLQTAFGWTYYHQNRQPSHLLQKGSIFHSYNFYDKKNPHNPYSVHQSVFDKKSFRNNFNRYSAHVRNQYGRFRGQIHPQIIHNQRSITNPYGKQGSIYSKTHPSNPYNPTKWDNPYSSYQNPYDPKSLRNLKKFHVQHYDSYGNLIGTTERTNTIQSKSVPSTFTHSPFEPKNTTNPYGKNKVFN